MVRMYRETGIAIPGIWKCLCPIMYLFDSGNILKQHFYPRMYLFESGNILKQHFLNNIFIHVCTYLILAILAICLNNTFTHLCTYLFNCGDIRTLIQLEYMHIQGM